MNWSYACAGRGPVAPTHKRGEIGGLRPYTSGRRTTLAKPLPLLAGERIGSGVLLTDKATGAVEGAMAAPAAERLAHVLDRRRQLRPALAAVMAKLHAAATSCRSAGVVRMFGVDQAAKLIRHPRAMTGCRRRGPHRFRHDRAATARLSAGRDEAQFSASDRRMTVFLPSFFALMRPRFSSS